MQEGACNSPLQVYEKAGTGPKDEDRFRLARDTQNPVAFDKRRNLGTYRTTTNMAYQAPQDVSTVHCLCLMWTRQHFRPGCTGTGQPVAACAIGCCPPWCAQAYRRQMDV